MNSILSRLLTILISAGIVAFFAMLYNFLVAIIPFVYINFFVTAGFGILLAAVAYFGCYFGHFHTNRSRLVYTVSLIAFGYIVQWLSFISFLILGNPGAFDVEMMGIIISQPIDLFMTALVEIYQNGAYNMFGIDVKQEANLVVWVLELFIIFLIPIRYILNAVYPPYAAVSQSWYPKYRLSDMWNLILDKQALVDALNSQNTAYLAQLGKGYVNKCADVYLYYHPQGTTAYISVWNNRASKSSGKIDRRLMIDKMMIPASFAKDLIETYPSKKAWISLDLK